MVTKPKREKRLNLVRAHCSYTPKLLVILAVITALTQYVGNPNRCTVDGVPLPEINEDCGVVGINVTVGDPGGFQVDVTVPAYYRWICWFLFLQAFLCYIPNWPRKTYEKLMEKFMAAPCSEKDFVEYKRILKKLTLSHFNHHNRFALAHSFCNVLCLANAVFQALMIHWFLNGHFMDGSSGIEYPYIEDKMYSSAFPDVVNCNVGRFDSFGKILKYEAMCSLPWNTLNEKIYIVLRIWFIILGILHLFVVIVLTFTMIGMRFSTGRAFCLRRRCRKIPLHLLECLSSRASYGDYLFLTHLGQAINNQSILSEIIIDVAKEFYREV